MADTKISALTAAITPLAGTEVLPIVQSGVTKQVSVANLTAGRAVSADSLTLTGSPLPATSGGTGQSSYAVGDLLYASTTTALSKLADVATGNALISGGVGVAPSWGKIGLTTHVSGTLPTANGGTNLSTFVANQVFYASSTSVMAQSSNLVFDGTNLGIGTTPSYGLQVSKSVSGDFAARISNTNTGNPNGLLIDTPNKAGASLYGLRIENSTTIAFSVLTNGEISASGNYTPTTAAKGINFTANSAAAGMTSQLLNWYEEGTYTPTWNGGSITTVVSAYYTKIGRQVTLIVDVILGTSSSASVSEITVPFTALSASNWGSGGVAYTTYGANLYISFDASTSKINFRPAANDPALACSSVASKRFVFTLTYFT